MKSPIIKHDTYSLDYFYAESSSFFEVMGDWKYSILDRFNAFKGLCFVALKCEDPIAMEYLEGILMDFEIRMSYFLWKLC